MTMCSYRCSTGAACYYEEGLGLIHCYFHDKVARGLITGYYENLTSESRESRWVSL